MRDYKLGRRAEKKLIGVEAAKYIGVSYWTFKQKYAQMLPREKAEGFQRSFLYRIQDLDDLIDKLRGGDEDASI